ncbi:MAG: Gfo/Idh/MocA family protein [Candidatus Dormibacteria bacterium]
MSSTQLRWGVLGAAAIAGQAVIPAILAAEGQVAALASRDQERGRELSSRFSIPLLFRTYQELVEAELDAVYIPLPNSLHLPWSLQAMAAGKHVLCEKPLALSAAEARQLGAAAHDRGVVLAEAVMYRHHPRWQTVRQLITSGELGRPRHLQGSFTFPLDPAPNIRWEAELGGGALYDVGSYLVSASRWLFGEPTRVLARQELWHGVDRDGSMLLEFGGADGPISAELAFSFAAAEHQQLEVIGTEGSLLVPAPFTAWRGEEIPLWLRRGPVGAAQAVATSAADPYQEMVLAFTARVRGGPPLPTTPKDSELGLRVLDAARRSVVEGAWARP